VDQRDKYRDISGRELQNGETNGERRTLPFLRSTHALISNPLNLSRMHFSSAAELKGLASIRGFENRCGRQRGTGNRARRMKEGAITISSCPCHTQPGGNVLLHQSDHFVPPFAASPRLPRGFPAARTGSRLVFAFSERLNGRKGDPLSASNAPRDSTRVRLRVTARFQQRRLPLVATLRIIRPARQGTWCQ